VAAVLLLLSGCASFTTTIYADEQMRPTLRALASKPGYPLARTLTLKHYYTVGKGSYEQGWFVADGRIIRGKRALDGVQIYAAQPATSGTSMADVYTQRAREASARGSHGEAQVYHGRAEVALQSQISAERTATAMALAGSIRALGDAMLDAVIGEVPGYVEKYVRQSRSVISERAPEGSVLELFIRAIKLDGDDAKPATATMQWETIATLKDADGKLWRSNAGFKVHIVLSNESKPVPAEFSRGRYVRMDPAIFIPAEDKHADWIPELFEIGKMQSVNRLVEPSVSAWAAIDALYAQIELARKGQAR
jgi:hypothetical protein